MSQQPQLPHFDDTALVSGPVACLGLTFESDDARRAYFSERLREKLQDPAFRQIEGFPIGEDADILALSDPPYYTACPNPFLPEIIAEWRRERSDLRGQLGLPADGENGAYQREPFAWDVAASRNNPFVNAHSYATKVPHEAVMTFLLHYTDPGDLVYDGFAGTGMTAVAAQLCDASNLELQARFTTVFREAALMDPRWGSRSCIVGDLSPAATYISANLNLPFDNDGLDQAITALHQELANEYGWMYETRHTDGRMGKIHATIWSDVFVCRSCGEEILFWDAAV